MADTLTVSGSVEPAVPSGLSTASGSLRMLLTNSVSSQLVSGPTSSSSRGALTDFDFCERVGWECNSSTGRSSELDTGQSNLQLLCHIQKPVFSGQLEECCNASPVYDGGVSSSSVSPRVTQAPPEAETVCGIVAVTQHYSMYH